MLIDELGRRSLNELKVRRSKTKSAVFHSAHYMLLGTHPIPARSPAEREGQTSKEMRTEGGGTEAGMWRGNRSICGGWRWGSENMDGKGGRREDGRETEIIEGWGEKGQSSGGAGVYLRGWGRGRENT